MSYLASLRTKLTLFWAFLEDRDPTGFAAFLRAVCDLNAVYLIVPAAGILAFIDLPVVVTLLQFMLFSAVLAGFVIQLTKVLFPAVQVNDLLVMLKRPETGTSIGAGLVLGGLLVFAGLVFLSVVIWTKPV